MTNTISITVLSRDDMMCGKNWIKTYKTSFMCKNNTTYNNKSIKTIIYIKGKTKLHQNLNTELILVNLTITK